MRIGQSAKRALSQDVGLQDFGQDRHGTVAVIMALSLSILMLCVGVSVDMVRWHQAQAMTNSALDAGVLAGGHSLQLNPQNTQAAIEAATATYLANTANRLPMNSDSLHFVVDGPSQTVVALGTAEMKTTVLSVMGIDHLGVLTATASNSARSIVSPGGPGGSNLEVSVMLDVTGSMCADGAGPCSNDPKMAALKAAATDLVNIVVRDGQTEHTTKVALVPFSTRVRVGPDGGGGPLMQALTNLSPLQSYVYNLCTDGTGGGGSESDIPWTCTTYVPTPVTDWKVMPCVTERFFTATGFDASDDAPGAGTWLNAHEGTRAILSLDSSDTPLLSGTGAPGDPTGNWNYTADGVCADILPGNEVMPLTSDKAALFARIGGLEAFGATSGALGTAWSWYMLSPNWGSVWTGASAPAPYAELLEINPNGAPKLRKVAIMMTDGGYNTLRSSKGQDQQMVSNHAMDLCDNMKAQHIEIFTVGFALAELPAGEQAIARATLQHCGTDLSHFYESLTLDGLQSSFRSIGMKLSGLRLSR